MSLDKLADRLAGLIGADATVTLDDAERPSLVRFHRPDPIADDLVRAAMARARDEFPEEMRAVAGAVISFEGTHGPTRRAVALD